MSHCLEDLASENPPSQLSPNKDTDGFRVHRPSWISTTWWAVGDRSQTNAYRMENFVKCMSSTVLQFFLSGLITMAILRTWARNPVDFWSKFILKIWIWTAFYLFHSINMLQTIEWFTVIANVLIYILNYSIILFKGLHIMLQTARMLLSDT